MSEVDVLPKTNVDHLQKYPYDGGVTKGISDLSDRGAIFVNHFEAMNIKKNQIAMYEKMKRLESQNQLLMEKFDMILEALALTPDSDEVKKRNAETMNMIANIKIEREEILRGK